MLTQEEVEVLILTHVSKLTGLDGDALTASIWREEGEIHFQVDVKEMEP